MARSSTKTLLLLISLSMLLGVVGCHETPSPTPTATPTVTKTPTITATPTITLTPTPTQTTTPAFTITRPPTKTSTHTPTPYRTLSPTPFPSQAPLRPAVLFPYEDIYSKTVDWSYLHVTEIGFNRLDEPNHLWAFMAFQLLDRAIYQRNLEFLGEWITVYYLNVAHEYDGVLMPMQLVLGGTKGANVAIRDIPAGGTAYVQVQIRDSSEAFSPRRTHREANEAYQLRDSAYPLMFIKELQAMLPTLPDEIILLADHPILFPPDNWPQVKLDMRRVTYLTARYQPFFEIDAYSRLADQSDFAYALRDHILYGQPMPIGLYAYSSQTLIIITGDH